MPDQPRTPAMWDAMCISAEDHVAVALRNLVGTVTVSIGDKLVQRVLPSIIPMGHKFAVSDLPAGTEIRKYGQVIGVLTQTVVAGEHVHVHNLSSLRARS